MGSTSVEVELGDAVDVLEDSRELGGHLIDFVVGELEPGEPCDVENLVAVDHRAHVRSGALSSQAQATGGRMSGRQSLQIAVWVLCGRARRWRALAGGRSRRRLLRRLLRRRRSRTGTGAGILEPVGLAAE